MKGLIPCAGLATRLRPLSLAIPKELLPIGPYPAVHHHVRDLLAAGIHDIVIVISPDKTRINDYLIQVFPEVQFRFVVQQEAKGLGCAILKARSVLGEDPFVMLLPDNLFFGAEALSQSLLDAFEHTRRSCVTLFKDGRYKPGSAVAMNVDSTEFRTGLIKSLHALNALPPERSVYFGPAALLFTAEVFGFLESGARQWDFSISDYSERPALEMLVERGDLYGVWVEGACFDIGTTAGYLDCVRYYYSRNEGGIDD